MTKRPHRASLLAALLTALSLAGCTTSRGGGVPAPPPPQTIDAGGYRVAYVRKGAGPTIVLLHGGGTWSYSWRRNIDALAHDHDVIAIDFYGHGYTRRLQPGAPSYRLQDASRFLAATFDALGVDNADIVGNSWGGGWALAFAQDHPDRVRRLVLIGSSGVPTPDRLEWEILRWPVLGDIAGRLVRRDDIADGLRAAAADPAAVSEDDVASVYAPFQAHEVRAGQIGFMRGLDFRVTAARLRDTRQRTLVIWGDHDAYVPRASQDQICRDMPDARLVVVENAGHVTHEDRPEIVDQLISSFLAEPDGGRPGDACAGAVAK